MRTGTRARALLGLGALAGLLAAAAGIVDVRIGREHGLPDGAAALVNDRAIRTATYERAVRALAGDRRDPIGPAERRHVLDRLIEEELLVQRALALGLADHDRRVRADLVAAMIQSVVAREVGDEPSDEELRAFHTRNPRYFARTSRLWVRQIWVAAGHVRSEAEAASRARETHDRLRAGEPFADVARALGDPALPPLPDGPLPLVKLREYIGPTAVRAVEGLGPGEVSDVLEAPGGRRVLVVVERIAGTVAAFESVEPEVRAEFVRRRDDAALRRYLDELRADADVRTEAEH